MRKCDATFHEIGMADSHPAVAFQCRLSPTANRRVSRRLKLRAVGTRLGRSLTENRSRKFSSSGQDSPSAVSKSTLQHVGSGVGTGSGCRGGIRHLPRVSR